MRPTRDAPLLAALALTAAALCGGGGVDDSSLPWLGAGALAAILVALALRGTPGGWWRLLPLAGLAAWCGLSVAWSTLPDRSWDYGNRALVYLLFALLGLWLGDRRRELALGFAALLGAVAIWSLAGLVFPGLNGDGTSSVRLSAPVGLWNQLALLGAFALPLALWLAARRRIPGTLLAYLWLVALVLTLSRGGIAVAAIVVLAWLALSGEAVAGVATLLAAALPAAVVCGVAFALPGVTDAGRPTHVRWHDGLIFGAVLVAGAVAAAVLARAPRPVPTARTRRAIAVVVALAVLAAIVAGVLLAGSAWRQFTAGAPLSNSGGRVTSVGSNFRWVWWKQAWHGFMDQPLRGNGAGTFRLTNLLYRRSSLDVTIEPHDLPVQFLSELGVVGLALAAAAFAALLGGLRRRGPELALALVLPAFALHALVDIDWDFVAVAGPAFLVAGAMVGRPGGRRISPFAVLAASGAALAVFVSLLLPWLGGRWSDQASVTASPKQAIALARKARSADPLLVDPVWTEAAAAPTSALQLRYYEEATRMQPHNPYTWLALGQFVLGKGCPRRAYPALQRFTDLDNYDQPALGANMKDRALHYVNSGKPDPPGCGD